MQVVVNDLLTNYTKTGSGELIVLLHGWGDNSKTFSDLQTELAKHYCVVSLDLPGFGSTQMSNHAWQLKDYAEFIKAFLDKIGESEIYGLLGHSNGGALAIYGLGQGILQAQKLILLGAAGIRNKQKARRLLIKLIAKTGKATTFWLPTSSKQKLRKKLYGVAGSDMLTVPHMQETFKQTVRQDVQAQAAQLKLPTLLIYGQTDRATPPMYGQLYNKLIAKSDLHIVQDAGHFVHHDQPQQTLQLIKDFLA